MSFALMLAFLIVGDVSLDPPVLALQTGAAFRSELDKPLTASWKDSPVRSILRQIAESRKISILLDRRIDPTRRLSFEFNQTNLKAALERIAAAAGGRLSVPGNTLLIGPPKPTSRLRTLLAMRSSELQRMALKLPRGRFARLGNRRTLHWSDLDRPEDILRQIAERRDLKLEGIDAVPHDLWGGATLPSTNAGEALSLILNQFDLTFEWNADASGVRLIPAPAEVAIERSYTPRGTSAQAAARDWPDKIEGLRTKVNGRRILVSGTVEQHEAVAALLRPRRVRSQVKPASSKSPLEQSYAKLKFERVPASGLIERLAKTGIEFKYDEDEFLAAEIDLKTAISMDLKDVTAMEIIAALCKQMGLEYRVDGSTVVLSPK